jgi:hypothetical protein
MSKIVYHKIINKMNKTQDLKRTTLQLIINSMKVFVKREKVQNKQNIRFRNKNQNLKTRKQMKTYLNYKPFKCEYNECNQSFMTSSRFRKHLKTIDNKQKSFNDYNKCDKIFG